MKKPTLREENERLREQCLKQSREIHNLLVKLESIEKGEWAAQAAELLGCAEENIVEELTKLQKVLDSDRLSMAEQAQELKEVADEAQADSERASTAADKVNDELEEIKNLLFRATEDRNALLKRLGLSDYQWSSQGGCTETDFEV